MHKPSYKILILTDHRNHTEHNTLYGLARAMFDHPRCSKLHVASRGRSINDAFFSERTSTKLEIVEIDSGFEFKPDGSQFSTRNGFSDVAAYDLIFLRLPYPVEEDFFHFLTQVFDENKIINRPSGILAAGSKQFLINFPQFCPPTRFCKTLDEIEEFADQFPIVLKPLRSYGGKGLIKVEGSRTFAGDLEIKKEEYISLIIDGFNSGGWLAMKFLRNVSEGDKRIVVVNGRIIMASLRMPPKRYWLFNVAQGGEAGKAYPDEREIQMVRTLSPILLEMGVVMYGLDTLVDDDGNRVLSEINALSIGGIAPMEKFYKKPLLPEVADCIFDYVKESGFFN